MNRLKNFTSNEHVNDYENSETTKFPLGRQNVTIDSVYFVTDMHRTLKTLEMKTKVNPWKDVTEQLAGVFKNDDGVGTHRFNACGYKRFSEIAKASQKNYTALGDEGYAVHNKTKLRVEDPVRTEKCEKILSQFFDACGLEIGSTPEDLAGCELSIMVDEKQYGDSMITVLKGWKKSGANAVVDLTEEVEEAEIEAEY